jgi:hypothetical protein
MTVAKRRLRLLKKKARLEKGRLSLWKKEEYDCGKKGQDGVKMN